jgi:hypothetical protein
MLRVTNMATAHIFKVISENVCDLVFLNWSLQCPVPPTHVRVHACTLHMLLNFGLRRFIFSLH